MTKKPGYEDRKGKVIAVRKKGDFSRILCAYSSLGRPNGSVTRGIHPGAPKRIPATLYFAR
jgi:hypothetical protein